MSFLFDVKKTINTVLFLLNSLGGKADFPRIGIILYFADLKHLAKYGTLLLGDSYVAMKFGPVPFGVLNLYKQCKGESFLKSVAYSLSEYFIIDEDGKMNAVIKYDEEYLSQSEVGCLFEAIQENKNLDFEALTSKAKNSAWGNSDINGEIPFDKILSVSGSSESMIKYIENNFRNELYSFNPNIHK